MDDGMRISAAALGLSVAETQFVLIDARTSSRRRSSLIDAAADNNRPECLLIRG